MFTSSYPEPETFAENLKIENSFPKGPDSKYFRLVGHTISVATTQLCCYSTKATINNTQMNGMTVLQ